MIQKYIVITTGTLTRSAQPLPVSKLFIVITAPHSDLTAAHLAPVCAPTAAQLNSSTDLAFNERSVFWVIYQDLGAQAAAIVPVLEHDTESMVLGDSGNDR